MNTLEVLSTQQHFSLLEAKKLFLNLLAKKTKDNDDAMMALAQVALETKKLFFYDGLTMKVVPINSSFYFSRNELSLIHHFMRMLFMKGREQKYFRQDISAELVGRLFLKRLLDIQTTEKYTQNRSLSYQTIYSLIINDFIKNIFSEQGKYYFKKLEEQTQPF